MTELGHELIDPSWINLMTSALYSLTSCQFYSKDHILHSDVFSDYKAKFRFYTDENTEY